MRALRAADVVGCASLVAATPLWQRYRYGVDRCESDLRDALRRGDRLTVAYADKTLLGLAWVLPRGGFGRSPYLKLLAVAPEARGLGVGARLLSASEEDGGLMLLVSDFNTGARRFYARAGYMEVGSFPAFVLPDVAEVLMWKPLVSAEKVATQPKFTPQASRPQPVVRSPPAPAARGKRGRPKH